MSPEIAHDSSESDLEVPIENHSMDEDKTSSNVPGRSRFSKIAFALLVSVSVAGVAAWQTRYPGTPPEAGDKGPSRGKSRSVLVAVATVQKMDVPIYLTALGTVTPYYSITVKPRVDGQLMSVNVREGQSVRTGEVLAEIDPRPFEAALIQAQGQLAKDEAQANYAKAEAKRYSELFSAGVVSRDSQELQMASAGQSSGALFAAQGAVQAAKLNLSYAKISSPIDGVVGLRQVDPGNMVHASDSGGLLLITQLHPISVRFILPEDRLPEIRKIMRHGGALTVEAYDRSDSVPLASGKLLTLDNEIDVNTGTDRAKAVFTNENDALFPNQFVNVRLILEKRRNATVIPSQALQTGADGTFVFVVKQGVPPMAFGKHHKPADKGEIDSPTSSSAVADMDKTSDSGGKGGSGSSYYAEVQPVVVDVIEGTQVILKSGLTAGEQIVIDGQERLQNGSKVTIEKDRPKGMKIKSENKGNRDNTNTVNTRGPSTEASISNSTTQNREGRKR
jgi:multidrug efflux system membrane fusion protein